MSNGDMTAEQPEPQIRGVLSCDSCEHAEKTNSRDYPVKCMVSKPVPMMVHNYCISWFGYVGCASHSAEPAPMVHKDCDNCHVYLQVKEARKQERERVLDELNNWMIGMPEQIREPIYQKIQSLRQQERERVLDELFPPNTKINTNGDLVGGWELDPKPLFELKKRIRSNPQYKEEPEAEVIEVVVLAVKEYLRKQGEP